MVDSAPRPRGLDLSSFKGNAPDQVLPAVTNDFLFHFLSFSFTGRPLIARRPVKEKERKVSVCKVRTQNPESFDEEVKSLVSAWRSPFLTDRQIQKTLSQKVSSISFLLFHWSASN